MKKPKISIVIPVYNGSNYLAEAIDSALAQTYKNIEIIVVNDGSKDDGATEKIALSYGDKIKYYHKENGGSSSALNYGIKMMTGEYFSWLSHDDLYKPERIEQMVKYIKPEISDRQAIVCNGELIDATGESVLGVKKKQLIGDYSSSEMFEIFKKGPRINGCAISVPKKMIDSVGFFDEKLVYVNDVDYWYRMMIKDCIFTWFDEKLVKTRIHGEQVSVKKKALLETENKILSEKILSMLISEKNEKLLRIFVKKLIFDNNYGLLKKHKDIKYKMSDVLFYGTYGIIIKILKQIYRKVVLKR